MELSQLKALVAIEQHGTISAAAVALNISQPSLSRTMKKLEADLGQELFTRKRNHVEFNEAGLLALKYARMLLADERAMRDAFDAFSRRQRTLKVASVAPAPNWRLTAIVIERYPDVIIDPVIMPQNRVEASLINREVDLAITLYPIQLPGITTTQLMTEDLSLSAPLDHPLANRTSVTFSELNGETFLVYEQIGFWMDMVRSELPDSQFIVQSDRMVFAQLMESTKLLAYTTNAPENQVIGNTRKAVPIVDSAAHAMFFLNARMDASQPVRDVMNAVLGSHHDLPATPT